MGLQSITADGLLTWACHTEECDFHESLLTAHVTHETVRYALAHKHNPSKRQMIDADSVQDRHLSSRNPIVVGSGAVIALPQCLCCGSQMFLKADYTLKEIAKDNILLPFIETDDNGIQGYVMKLGHARNFRLLHMLYEAGKMPEKPILTTLPIEIIAHSPLAQYPLDIIDAFWLPFALTRKAPPIAGIYEPLMAMQHLLPEIIVPRIMAMEDRRIG